MCIRDSSEGESQDETDRSRERVSGYKLKGYTELGSSSEEDSGIYSNRRLEDRQTWDSKMEKIAGKADFNAKAIDRQRGRLEEHAGHSTGKTRLSKQYVDFSRRSSDQEYAGRLEPDSDDTSSGNEDIEKGKRIKVGQYQSKKLSLIHI